MADDSTRQRIEEELTRVQMTRDGMLADMAERTDDGGGPGRADAGRAESDALHLEIERATLAALGREVSELRAALKRLDDGIYGRCEGCGGAIEPGRLEAVPATRRCRQHADAPGPLVDFTPGLL